MIEAEWLDISLPIGPETPVYPGDPPVEVVTVASLANDPYHLSRITMGSHTGTHVDAPAHFVRGGETLAEIPLGRFSGPAWVLELPKAPAIEAADLAERWPDEPIERILLKTPNSQRWGKEGKQAESPRGERPIQALSPSAAEWLIGMGVSLVGIDALSIESDDTGCYPVHHLLLGYRVLILEGLDLRNIAPGPYELLCLPLRLTVPDGAPVRAVLRCREAPRH